MNTTQQPEALNLEEFRAKVTRAAREPLLARIAELEDVADMAIKHISELEAQLSAIGAGGVEPLRKRAGQQEAHHAEGVLEQAGTYAEARECEHCNHVGINDAANGIASCTACKWNGDSPKEDKCPDCEAEGAMTASCPKCHHEYRLIADATLAATQPAAQGMEKDAARYRWLRSRDLETISQGGVFAGMTPENVILNGEDLDEAVDAAIAAQANQGEKK